MSYAYASPTHLSSEFEAGRTWQKSLHSSSCPHLLLPRPTLTDETGVKYMEEGKEGSFYYPYLLENILLSTLAVQEN